MYLADYHTHSRFSPDGRASMAEMARAAEAAGLDEICFTDHVEPMDWRTEDPRAPYDWEELLRLYREAEEAENGRITLRLGVELGDACWNYAHTESLMASAPELDFIIGSVHILPPSFGGHDLYFFDPQEDKQAREGIAAYLEEVLDLARWGRFTVLGHLTLPLRYLNENRGFHLTFDGFEAEVAEIFRTLIQGGRGIELNTNRGGDPLPGEKWLRMYRDLGGEQITLGTDAHRPRDVGASIREGQALLRQCGFRRFCTYEKRRPIWHDL